VLSFSFSPRPLLLCLALATPILQAQQSPTSPGTPSAAPQAGDAQCILAGRWNTEGRWAPQAAGVQLLDAGGKPVSGATQSTLSNVKAVRLAEPALLSKCNAGQAMLDGDARLGGKSPAPALAAGNAPLEVQAITTLPGRSGARWVELRVSAPAERVVMLTR
jgi:hypothetical protein